MISKTVLAALFLVISVFGYCQKESFGEFDSSGKKHGKWLVYLDHDWKKVNDSTKAFFKRYTYFDHGINIYPMGACGGKNYKLEPAATNVNSKTQIILLDGEYKWYDGKGRLSSVHVLKNGEYISCKEYHPSGVLNQFFDYTKKCSGQEHGWMVYIYDKNGNMILASPTCKDKNGKWPPMRG